MENVSYISLSRQIVLRDMMDMTANNVANMSTPGFKAQNILLDEAIVKARSNGERPSQVMESGSYRNFAQGSLSRTGNKLDAAIQGDGYFAIGTPAGVRYTRAGNFTLNNEGQIVTQNGYAVLDDGGAPITIPAESKDLTIAQDGTISTEEGEIGVMQVVSFADEAALVAEGDNLFSADETLQVAVENPQVLQGMIEASNVQPVIEMNRMIEVLRSYQAMQNILQADHERAIGMIQKLTRV